MHLTIKLRKLKNLKNEEKFLEFINQNTKYDACIMLGDHYDRDINIIFT